MLVARQIVYFVIDAACQLCADEDGYNNKLVFVGVEGDKTAPAIVSFLLLLLLLSLFLLSLFLLRAKDSLLSTDNELHRSSKYEREKIFGKPDNKNNISGDSCT